MDTISEVLQVNPSRDQKRGSAIWSLDRVVYCHGQADFKRQKRSLPASQRLAGTFPHLQLVTKVLKQRRSTCEASMIQMRTAMKIPIMMTPCGYADSSPSSGSDQPADSACYDAGTNDSYVNTDTDHEEG
ncbi:hypothetical protein HPB50_008527 [Hyalomma asiaticum]|uniref:Uncharacterized protein n=1 Tax=Hyalomma asiaticum TaxID=266040 RepID=A0ACB7RJX9_HYAAI|nr:hypothetical protein HPB50_008527 [Hyalomma asiaticum]